MATTTDRPDPTPSSIWLYSVAVTGTPSSTHENSRPGALLLGLSNYENTLDSPVDSVDSMDVKNSQTRETGNVLNLTPKANRSQADYYSYWKQNPESLEPSAEDIKCELQLQALGDFELLNLDFNHRIFEKEIAEISDWFVPYLRRDGISNDREGLLLVGLEGDKPNDSLSRPEAIKRAGRFLLEKDFNTPTEAYTKLTSLHSILDYWGGLGRTMIIKANRGGWFPPHRDCLLYTSPSPRDRQKSRMPSSA